MENEMKPVEAAGSPQTKAGGTELYDGVNDDHVAVWSQLEVGDTYQRQLDQIRQLAV